MLSKSLRLFLAVCVYLSVCVCVRATQELE